MCLRFLVIFDPHLDLFKVVDLEISCLGSRSLIPELEYVSNYVFVDVSVSQLKIRLLKKYEKCS